MANNYDKILELANANNMGLSNTIKRDFGIPLDYTSVQASYEAALTYAATNTLAYVGQPISVGDKLYIVTAESQGKYPAEVEEGGSQIDVFLAEVGSATEGDGSTIDLKDGVLSLHGIDGKTSGTYMPKLVDGVLTWYVPSATTVEGLDARLNTAESDIDALQLTINGREAGEGVDAVKGLSTQVEENTSAISKNAEEISKNAKAISDETAARGQAISDAVSNLEGQISSAKQEAIAAIPTNVSDFTNDAGYLTEHQDISGKADKADKLAGYGITDAYTKDETDSAIAAAVADQIHMSTVIVDAAPSVEDAKAGVIYLVQDPTANAGNYIEYILVDHNGVKAVEAIGSTKTDLSEYAKTADVNAKLDEKLDTSSYNIDKETFALKSDVESALGGKVDVSTYTSDKSAIEQSISTGLAGKVDNATLDSYYTKTEIENKGYAVATTVEAALANKVETAQIRHTSEGVGEGITKEGTALTITVDAYTKSEVYTKSETDAAITAKINSVTGGESAADVKLALEDYRDALNAEMWGEDAKKWTVRTTDDDGKVTVTYTPQYGTTSRIDTLESKIATAETNITKAQNTADAAALAVSTLETNKVDVNTQAIAGIQASITGKDGLSARIGNLEVANSTHATEYANLKAKVDTAVDTTIPGINGRIDGIDSSITTINGSLETQLGLINTKANASDVYTKGEVDGFVSTLTTEVGKKADASNTYTKGEVDTAISNAISNIDTTAIDNNTADIATLIGSDKDENGRVNKSIRTIAADEINTLIKAADPEGGKTIENINNLIKYVDENAGQIAALITETDANTAKLADITGTVGATIDAKIEAAKYILNVATSEKLGGIKSAVDTVVTDGESTVSKVAENKVYVAEDGIASVKAVNVNTLTQTDGDVLVLNGGSAT